MGRQARREVAGSIYHALSRGVERRRIFVDDHDYETYLRLLALVTQRQGWHLLCFCLMPNHVHLLIETPETNLGAGMGWLHGMYATAFNERHARVGHLFGDRFKSPMTVTDEAFVRTVGYVILNPVDAQLCRRAEDWRWGSHALVSSPEYAPPWLAHARLVERLEAATGLRCYPELVSAWERSVIDAKRRKGTVPFAPARQ